MYPESWKKRTHIMGIINITPDSFSDGGEAFNIDDAVKKAIDFINIGVDILDIGAQSTRPNAEEVGEKEEINRILPSLREIRSYSKDAFISIDTFSSKVAYEAISNGANWINDISGGRRDPDIFKVASDLSTPIVITHSRGNSKTMNQLCQYENIIKDVQNEIIKSIDIALNFGVKASNIIVDPGIGFAKDELQNFEIIKNINDFKKIGFPILIGASRKRFLGNFLDINNAKDRDYATLAISSFCIDRNIDVLRVHNAKANLDLLKILNRLKSKN